MPTRATVLFALAFAVAVNFALTAPVRAQTGPFVPKPSGGVAPMAATTPPAAPGIRGAPTEGPDRIAPNTPRVGPIPSGQVLADDYRIGPQDLIEVQVFGIDSLRRDVRVNANGVISLPLVGPVVVSGLTSQEAEKFIAAAYTKDFLQDPQVSVFVKESLSQRITIEGAVARPGIYPIRGQTTLLQAMAIAGGGASLANLQEVRIFRIEGGDKRVYIYDIDKIRSGEIEDPSLVNDDLLVVNRSVSRVMLRDSLLSDFFGLINPFSYIPH